MYSLEDIKRDPAKLKQVQEVQAHPGLKLIVEALTHELIHGNIGHELSSPESILGCDTATKDIIIFLSKTVDQTTKAPPNPPRKIKPHFPETN